MNRWVVTGTPYQNEILELQSFFKFLKIEPLCKESFWKLRHKNPDLFFDTVKETLPKILLRRVKMKNANTRPKKQSLQPSKEQDKGPSKIAQTFKCNDINLNPKKNVDSQSLAESRRKSVLRQGPVCLQKEK